MDIQLFLHHLLKKLSLLPLPLLLCQRKVDSIYGDIFIGSLLFCSLDLIVYSFATTHLDSYSFVVRSDSIILPVCLSFNVMLAVLGLLPLHKTLVKKLNFTVGVDLLIAKVKHSLIITQVVSISELKIQEYVVNYNSILPSIDFQMTKAA